jgi:hypothetical protein
MTDARDLRKRAAQARRAASVKTTGGQAADRHLLELANQLDRDADEIERGRASGQLPVPDDGEGTAKAKMPRKEARRPNSH